MRRRFISFLLVVFILFPLVPSPVLGKGAVKEIDVLLNNFRLQVEGKNLSHKDVFLYEGDVYVPMTDFGKALGLSTNFDSNKRSISLVSKDRLKFDDKSKYPIAYQKGYEIDASIRIMDNINKEIGSFLSGTISKSKSKDMDLKSIKVSFSDVNVFLNGKKIYLDGEAFIYNNDMYLPLTALSPYLYITPKLNNNIIDIDCNGVLLDKQKGTLYPTYYSIDELVKFREELMSRYARELEELNKKKKIIMDVKIPYTEVKSLSDMEKYLNRYLGKIKELNVDINLRSGTNNWYYVEIDFPTRDNGKWRSLSRRDVEAHIWDIYVAISSLYDEDAKVQGNIRKYVTFDTKMKNIVFSFIDSGLSLTEKVDPVFIQELLNKEIRRYNGEYFDYAARISGYDLELIVTPSSGDFIEKWSASRQLDFFERINNEIKRYYPGLKVNGKVLYRDLTPIIFTIEGGKVRSNAIMDSTSQYLNDRYGVLNANGTRIPLKYSLHQVDTDNFKLMVDMDFLISDTKWNREAKDALADLMHEVIKYIIDNWNANVFVQVYDKSQALAYEYIVSQDTVYMVKASPSGGDIVEGTTITLSTETIGAKIYYTTDGSMPSTNSTLYTKPIPATSIIRAFAVKDGYKDSSTATFEYNIVADTDMAVGLDKLEFSVGSLNKKFDKKDVEYTLTVPYGTTTIRVMPVASIGSITVNGSTVVSGDGLDVEASTITVVHSEEGKSKKKTYNITVKFEDKEESNVELADGYEFNTSIYGVFSGRLTGDYGGHKVKLLYGTGSSYKEVTVESDGSFEISGFDIDPITVFIGYKYEILDKNDAVVVGPIVLK